MIIMNGVEQMIAVAAINAPAHEAPMYVVRPMEKKSRLLTIRRDAIGIEIPIAEIGRETVEKTTSIDPVIGIDPEIGDGRGIEM